MERIRIYPIDPNKPMNVRVELIGPVEIEGDVVVDRATDRRCGTCIDWAPQTNDVGFAHCGQQGERTPRTWVCDGYRSAGAYP